MPANTAPTFTIGDGIVNTDLGTHFRRDTPSALLVQADGKIVVIGYAGGQFLNDDDDTAVVRYNADGSLDTGFGVGGKALLDAFGQGWNESVTDIKMLSDGKLLLLGTFDGDPFFVRLNSDGTPDASFGNNGVSRITTPAWDNGDAFTVMADGSIVIVGTGQGSNEDISLIHILANGALDPDFGTDGIALLDLQSTAAPEWGVTSDSLYDVTGQSDGKIVAVGRVGSGSFLFQTSKAVVLRCNTDGSLDAGFGGGDGVAILPVEGPVYLTQVEVLASGKILVAGVNDGWALLGRFNSDGTVDTSFGSDGVVFSVRGGYEDALFAFQSDGSIILAGSDGFVSRYSADGVLDTSFGTDGVYRTGLEYTAGVQVLADGKILVSGALGGHDVSPFNEAANDFAVVRLNADGTPDTSFGVDSTLDNSLVSFVENGAAVLLDGDVQVFDAELAAAGNYAGASVTLARQGGANGDDGFSAGAAISSLTQGATLTVSGVDIGHVDQNAAGVLTLSFNANASQSLVNTALQNIKYSNSNDRPPSSVQIDWTFSDGVSATTDHSTVTLFATNDLPVVTLPTTLNFTEDTPGAITGISVAADPDAADYHWTPWVYLSVGTGALAATATAEVSVNQWASNSLTLYGAPTDINAYIAAGHVIFTPALNATADVNLHVVTNDSADWQQTFDLPLTITPVVDQPLTVAGGVLAYTENQWYAAIDPGITLTDAYTGNLSSVTVRISGGFTPGDRLAGLVNHAVLGWGSYDVNTGVYTLTGDASYADYQSVLRNVAFFHDGENPTGATRTITWTIPTPDGDQVVTSSVNVTGVNDTPGLSSWQYWWDSAIPVEIGVATDLLDFTVSDAESATLSLTLTPTNGVINNVTDADPVADGIQITDTIANLNSLLAGATFTATGSGAAQFTISISDGEATLNVTDAYRFLASNSAPSAAGLPAGVTVTEDLASPVDLSGLTLTDANGDPLTLTLSASSGALAAVSGGNVTVSGSGTGALTLVGSAADLNAFLDSASNIQYTTALNDTTARSIVVSLNDGVNPPVNAGSVAVTITPVNDAPTLAGLPVAALEVEAGVATALDNFTVADADSNTLTLTLTASNGVIHNIIDADPATAGIQRTDNAFNLNALLANLSFTATAAGAASISVSLSDGVNPAATGVYQFNAYGNTAPSASGLIDAITVTEDVAGAVDLSALDLVDVDDDVLTLTLSAASGTLAAQAGGGVTVAGSGSGALQLTGSAASLHGFLDTADSVLYTTAANDNTQRSITVTLDDGLSPALSVGAIEVSILPVNDAPLFSVGSPGPALVEAGGILNATPGEPFSVALLSLSDLETTAYYTAPLLEAAGWTTPDAGVTYQKAGVYGLARYTLTSGNLTYLLDNEASATQALKSDDVVFDSFTLVATDGELNSNVTVQFQITGANDTPSLATPAIRRVNDTSADDRFSPLTGQLLGADGDADATLTFTLSGGLTELGGSYGVLRLDSATGAYTYTPDDSAVEGLKDTASDSFTVRVSDGVEVTQATLQVDLIGVDDLTEFSGDTTGAVAEDGVFSADGVLSATDREAGDAAITPQTGSAGSYGSFSIDAAGVWTYTLDNNAAQRVAQGQTAQDVLTVATAGGGTQAITVSITGVNDAPTFATPTAITYTDTAANDTFTVANGALAGSDVDDGASLSYGLSGGTVSGTTATLAGSYGTLSLNTASGAYTYTPNDAAIEGLKANASDSFTVSVSDGLASATATLQVNLTGANDTPTVNSAIPNKTAYTGRTFTYQVSSSAFGDRDSGDTRTYTARLADGSPLPLWLSFNANTRTFSGTPSNPNIGVLTLRVTATDGSSATVSDDFTLTVNQLVINGTSAANTLTGTTSGDVINGLGNNDSLSGGNGNDTLNGGDGNDTLDGGSGNDSLSGGAGDDLYRVNASGDVVVEASGQGTDTVQSAVDYTLLDHQERLILLAGTTNLKGTGNSLGNVLTGNDGANTLDGKAGADTLIGGKGDDTYGVDVSGDVVTEVAGGGTDTVKAGLSFSFNVAGRSELEHLTLTGTGGYSGTGNAKANLITGNSGKNALKGEGGNDTLAGGAGADTLTGGAGADKFKFVASTEGLDTLTDFTKSQTDKLIFVSANFGGLAVGTLASANFRSNLTGLAGDADDRFIFETDTKILRYDRDGTGAAAAVQIAKLNINNLSASDIQMVAS